MEWISASEGEKWQQTMNNISNVVDRLGVDKIRDENKIAIPKLDKQLAKFRKKIE